MGKFIFNIYKYIYLINLQTCFN